MPQSFPSVVAVVCCLIFSHGSSGTATALGLGSASLAFQQVALLPHSLPCVRRTDMAHSARSQQQSRFLGTVGSRPLRRMGLNTALASSTGGNEQGPQNATSKFEPGLPKGLRPIGVSDTIEGISQAPKTLYEEYRQKVDSPTGVGSKIGLEKREGAQGEDEGFALSSNTVETGRDRIVQDEANLVNLFSNERGFIGAGVGVVALFFLYSSLYTGGGSGSVFGSYGAGAAPPPGKSVVVERFEEAYLCYGIPSPDDPNGCRDRRSVGPVRVFSREPAPGSPAPEQPSPPPAASDPAL